MSLFRRFREAISASENQADLDPHAWQLPSSFSTPKPGGKQTIIPSPRIFASALIPRVPQAGNLETALAYPDIGHAAVHLALLECFWSLRLSANALDIEVDRPPAYEEKPRTTLTTAPASLPKSQRWNLLVDLAVARFTAWWSNIDDVLRHATAYAHHGSDKVAVQLTKDYLPPLDVLLIWYAFMLDTDSYNQCRSRMPQIQHLSFPWPAIRDAIDMEKMHFVLPRGAQALFSNLSGQSADILTYLKNPPAYSAPGVLPVEVDLAAEVKKYENFIDKAHTLLWIRAPSLNGSLSRASEDYLEFQLREAIPGKPQADLAFGIELLWQTHRLFPSQYDVFVGEIGSDQQSSDVKGLEPQTRRVSLGKADPHLESIQCLCWTCERIRDDIPTFVHSSPLNASSSSTTPAKDIPSQLSCLSSDQIRLIQNDVGFYTAVEDARRRHKTLPTRPPTEAEREVERRVKERQKELGYLPGLNDYVEVLPDGTRKIRTQKQTIPYGNIAGI
ncbi:hypothetical protein B0J13DRAFT_167289 [Dactylonectria estremocensis]|uniref:Uncharacterized protein n=1 Tax=Dactylonectria estremocensis TaxID=1079267 RepID=A0A9P9FB67_9HYPO|nr:hypothetical protein B0J13DRAFT_167289 [Dactylonectria estremocensis]